MFGMPWFTANVFEFVMIFTQPERGPRPITQELAPTSSVGKLAKLHTQAVDNTSTNISLLVVRCLNTFCRVSCIFQCAVVLSRPLPRSLSFWPHRLWISVASLEFASDVRRCGSSRRWVTTALEKEVRERAIDIFKVFCSSFFIAIIALIGFDFALMCRLSARKVSPALFDNWKRRQSNGCVHMYPRGSFSPERPPYFPP